jgi:hypothetical protein
MPVPSTRKVGAAMLLLLLLFLLLVQPLPVDLQGLVFEIF